ncbi:hypothetical protein RRSWK_02324 [Rhodopirellula sp. SWK7]|nr:hypothetical protein RRSWK_02324 [Rhodopirellula sp. SWK7]
MAKGRKIRAEMDAGASLICSCVAIVDCIETSATDLSLKSLGCPHRRAA